MSNRENNMKPNTQKTDFLSTIPGILTAAVAANLLIVNCPEKRRE